MPQLGALKCAVGAENVFAKVLCNAAQRRLTWRHHRSAGDVGIHTLDATLRKVVCRSTFATADTAGEPDEKLISHIRLDVLLWSKNREHVITNDEGDPTGDTQKWAEWDGFAAALLGRDHTHDGVEQPAGSGYEDDAG